MDLELYLLRSPALVGIISGLLFLIYYKSFSIPVKIIGWYIIFTFSIELWGNYLASLGKNNLVCLHVFTLGQLIFSIYFFKTIFNVLNAHFIKNWHIGLLVTAVFLNSILIQPIDTYNSYSKTFTQFIIIILCVLAYQLFTIRTYQYEHKKTIKIFISALLLSCSASLTLYLFSEQIMQMNEEVQRKIWKVNVISNLVTQVLYLWGIVHVLTTKKKLQIG